MSAEATTTQSNAASGAMSYRRDIDGLRAIAVLGVIAFHSGLPHFPGGFVGVDVFFVISGFLITGLLSAEFERSGTISLRNFFVRRIRRLLPALALVVTTTLGIAMVSMFPLELHRLGKSAQAVATLVANVHFRNFSGGYFDPSTDVMPLLHTWSLAVEEQYYLIWPLLFLLTHRLVRPQNSNVHRTTIATLLFVFVASFAACIWMTSHDRLSAFYLTPYRAWEFALGALLAHTAPWLRNRLPARAGDGLLLAGLAAILGMILFYDDRTPFPGAIALIPVLGSLAVIAGGCAPGATLPNRVLGNRMMVGIGLISYSLYLWHWPLLALARDYSLGTRELPRDLGLVALSFVLAWLTYRFVENPIRQFKPGAFATIRGSFRIGFLISFFVVAAANGVMDWSKQKNADLNKHNIVPSQLQLPNLSIGSCDQQGQSTEKLISAKDCTLGSPLTPIRIMALGDSHTGHLIYMYEDISRRFGMRTLFRGVGACPPLLDVIPFKQSEGRYWCGKYNDLVFQEAANETKESLRGIVLSARWNFYLALPVTEPGGTHPYALANDWKTLEQNDDGKLQVGLPPLDTNGSIAAFKTGLTNTLSKAKRLGLRVLIVAPVPELYFHGSQCVYRRSEAECRIPRAKVEARRRLTTEVINEVTKKFDQVKVFDPISMFCDTSTCYTKRNGILMYGDDNHISPDMSLLMGQRMDPLLRWVAGITDSAK